MIQIEEMIAVIIFGALGSLFRFLLSRWVSYWLPRDFPWGILCVNILGCLIMGVLTGMLLGKMTLNPFWRAGILIGFLGGFTTFSSFSIDTVTLFLNGMPFNALLNIVVSVVGGVAATFVGLFFSKLLV